MAAVLDDLAARGLIQDSTDRQALSERLDAGPITVYCGLDPTADSLHVGNLQSLLLLRRFQDHGHRAIALAGGATGLIGDPSGRDSERTLLDDDTVTANVAAITAQMRRFIDFDGPNAAVLVDNRDWTAPMSVLEFLRDVGKHVTVNTMLARDSVRSRMERDSGLSYTEFSYMLLQANDYSVLQERHGCELQVAGSDQWGNIVAGVDLIRRQRGIGVHALTAPLIVSSDGKKFGKSTGGGGLWLDPARTSPYQLFQYFMATDDRDVESWLLRLTLLEVEEIRRIAADHATSPHERRGQRRLASEMVSLIHGHEAMAVAVAATDALFGTAGATRRQQLMTDDVLASLAADIPLSEIARSEADELGLVGVVARAFGTSKGDVRRNLVGFSVGATKLAEILTPANPGDSGGLAGTASGGDTVPVQEWLLLRKGKSSFHLVRFTPSDTGVDTVRTVR